MASVSSHNNGIPLSTLLEWYKIRDTLFGQNGLEQNVAAALEMAASCAHSDCEWLTAACAGKGVKTREDARKVFLALGQNDARALCFAYMFGDGAEIEDIGLLQRSAERGFAFAQAQFGMQTDTKIALKFARMAAAQGERDGFVALAGLLRSGEGCDKKMAKENYLLACNLGDVSAMIDFGNLLANESLGWFNPQTWHWWGLAAKKGKPEDFLANFADTEFGFLSEAVIFEIGQTFYGHVNVLEGTIFNVDWNFVNLLPQTQQAILFFESQLKASRLAVDEWTKVGIRLKVVKDVRKLIAELIWCARGEALYDVSAALREQRSSPQSKRNNGHLVIILKNKKR